MRFIILFLTLFCTTAHAAENDFDAWLNDLVSEYGVYDNGGEIFYAAVENLVYERDFLLVCRNGADKIYITAYGETDGGEPLDTLEFEKRGDLTLSLAYYDDTAHIACKSGGKTDYYGFISGSFTSVPEIYADDTVALVRYNNGKIDTFSHSAQDIYNLINSQKKDKINQYPYLNSANTSDNIEEIKTFLGACAHLTSFDIKSYDYDSIFKYVLYTHEDFAPLTTLLPYSDTSSQIRSVSGEYIDFIMNNILSISPIHPEYTELVERGFCYKDGKYLYMGGFDGDYDTEILDIEAVFDLGGGVEYVIFSDIYTENNSRTPEYSVAVINTSAVPYKLLRLGMGENLLTTAQVEEYAVSEDLTTPLWEQTNNAPKSNGALYILAVSAAVLLAAVIFIFAKRRR